MEIIVIQDMTFIKVITIDQLLELNFLCEWTTLHCVSTELP